MRDTNAPYTNRPPQDLRPGAMTIREFCAWSGIGRTAIYKQAKLGRLKLSKVGSKTLVRWEDAQAWLNALPAASVGQEVV
jgi:excisionase family DNA binding protein